MSENAEDRVAQWEIDGLEPQDAADLAEVIVLARRGRITAENPVQLRIKKALELALDALSSADFFAAHRGIGDPTRQMCLEAQKVLQETLKGLAT